MCNVRNLKICPIERSVCQLGGIPVFFPRSRVLVERERGINVLHERVAEEPDVVTEADVLSDERTDALARAGLRLAEAEAIKAHM